MGNQFFEHVDLDECIKQLLQASNILSELVDSHMSDFDTIRDMGYGVPSDSPVPNSVAYIHASAPALQRKLEAIAYNLEYIHEWNEKNNRD